MHEIGIIQSMLTMAEKHAKEAEASRIHEIRMLVGRMSGVVPEALEHGFAVLRQGTMAEEAQLIIDYVPAVCWCATCQKEFESPGLWSECPDCGTPSLEVRSGLEVQLMSMEVD
jgi:hydrogenase nickel incorporation protein HypA/HybF